MIYGLPTFDVEAINWSVPIAIGFFTGEDYKEFVKEYEKDDVVWRFLSYLKTFHQGIKLYAHCASKFDNKFILNSLLEHQEKVSLEAGLVKLRWNETEITFEDSYLVIPMSLDRAGKLFGVEPKKSWDHKTTRNPWEMGSRLPTFLSYLKTDCISLSETMGKVCELLGTTFGLMPSISLSTTAAKVFDRVFYPLEDIHPNEQFEEFIRGSIYGGRNEVYKKYGENIKIYDIKGMFVSCYDTPVPISKLMWTRPNIDKGTLAQAKVKVPRDWSIGPLPYKVKGRLIFPVGEFEGWWDIVELRNAASLGVDVDIKRQLQADEEPVLESFGRFTGSLRGSEEDIFWKMFGLSLSGKFGQGRWRDVTKHIDKIENLRGWTPIDTGEVYYSTKEYLGDKAPYIKPAVAMRIRAEARVRHLRIILEAMSQGEIYYGDTDSIYTTSMLQTGEGVGDLQLIGKAERGYFIKQKLYGYIQKGKLTQKSSGYSDLKLGEEDFKSLLKGRELDTEGGGNISSYKSLLKGEELKLLKTGKRIKSSSNQDNRKRGSGDWTEPLCIPDDLRE